MGKQSIFWLVLGLILFTTLQVHATHIVGGEFELQYIERERYRLRLILYNDDIFGNPGAIDASAQVFIWRKKDNAYMGAETLYQVARENVPYTNPTCAIARLKTSKVIYSSEVYLSGSRYNDPDGYYVTYERCCRNNSIFNIERPGDTGQTFYLEFPPVVRDGEPFINSSPILFPPLSDFARLGYPFFFDFSGTDPDGDSLVYSLVNPLAGFSTPDFPIPSSPKPAPYPEVVWRPGYGTTNMVPGNPALTINQKGLLRVKPSLDELYVFSVLAEEFRNGKKIGEVRRDFQMLVYNVAGEDFPPQLEGQKPNGQIFKDKIQIVDADFPEASGNRCISLTVTDKDIQQEDGFREDLRFRIVPQNFSDASAIQLSVSQGSVTADNPQLYLNMCLPECPPVFNQPYKFLVVAYDDACSVPLTDTLHVEVRLTPPPNAPAHFYSLEDNTPKRTHDYTFSTVQEGRPYEFFIEGFDDDGDDLQFSWIPDGFDAALWGFSFEPVKEEVDNTGRRKVRYKVRWDAVCSDLRNFGMKDKFKFKLNLDDRPDCDQHAAAKYDLSFSVVMPGNRPPEALTSLNNYVAVPNETVSIEVPFGQDLEYAIRGQDNEPDMLRLRAVGKDFNLSDWGMSFESTAAVSQVAGTFRWNPSCGMVSPDGKHEFTVYFIARDEGDCKSSLSDTITVNMRVTFPQNEAPALSASSVQAPNDQDEYVVAVGEELQILLRGIDANLTDNLNLALLGIDPFKPTGVYTWQNATGSGGEVQSVLSITPTCELLQGAAEVLLTFNFSVNDDPCYEKQADQLSVKVVVKEKPQDFERVRYVNFFSPNGDRCNPWFEIRDLPEDTCNNRFESVQVYNRWGKLIFQSSDRHFKWDGEGNAAGTYYYLLKYTSMTYRSPLTLSLGNAMTADSDCSN